MAKLSTTMMLLVAGGALMSVAAAYFITSAPVGNARIQLMPNDTELVSLGGAVYVQNCAACHGAALQGQANWRSRMANGRLPAPPHDETGHTWHHPDDYLFAVTKYGIEAMIKNTYPNNMPAYEDQLSDREIIAVLSYIKSQWPRKIQRQHDQISQRSINQ